MRLFAKNPPRKVCKVSILSRRKIRGTIFLAFRAKVEKFKDFFSVLRHWFSRGSADFQFCIVQHNYVFARKRSFLGKARSWKLGQLAIMSVQSKPLSPFSHLFRAFSPISGLLENVGSVYSRFFYGLPTPISG